MKLNEAPQSVNLFRERSERGHDVKYLVREPYMSGTKHMVNIHLATTVNGVVLAPQANRYTYRACHHIMDVIKQSSYLVCIATTM